MKLVKDFKKEIIYIFCGDEICLNSLTDILKTTYFGLSQKVLNRFENCLYV